MTEDLEYMRPIEVRWIVPLSGRIACRVNSGRLLGYWAKQYADSGREY